MGFPLLNRFVKIGKPVACPCGRLQVVDVGGKITDITDNGSYEEGPRQVITLDNVCYETGERCVRCRAGACEKRN